jgi:hypothetical protein
MWSAEIVNERIGKESTNNLHSLEGTEAWDELDTIHVTSATDLYEANLSNLG